MTKKLKHPLPLELRPHVRYEIINNINGNKYTGITWTPKDRWSKHKTTARKLIKNRKENKETDEVPNKRKVKSSWTIHKAMSKYGIENFSFVIVENFPNRSSASEAEAKATTTGEYAYNEAPGGLNGAGGSCMWTEEGRNRIIEASKNPKGPMPEWHKEAIRQGHLNNPKPFSDEHKAKISAAKKGVPKSEEQKQRLRELRIGVSLSPESVAKIVAKTRGRKRSPETIARMVEGQRIRREKEREIQGKGIYSGNAKSIPQGLSSDKESANLDEVVQQNLHEDSKIK